MTELPISTLVKFEQPENAHVPMLVTEFPSFILFIEVLPWNHESIFEQFKVKSVKSGQLENAELPMLVTELPISTFVNLEQSRKA